MARKNTKSTNSAGLGGFGPGVLRALLIHGTAILLVLGGGALGYARLRQHVAGELALPQAPPAVVLRNRPVWMSDALAGQILRSAQPREVHSAMDARLLQEIAHSLARNPWVRNVRQVRRIYGHSAGDIVEIDCEFRDPIALVAARGEYILVDSEGYRLPEKYPALQPPRVMFAADGTVNLRIIEGVAAMPPFLDGQKWSGEDLQAGLDLARLLYGRDFTEEIHRVNVANFKGRRNAREAQLTLVTRYGTTIRWGEPVRQTYHAELAPGEKLTRLALLRQQKGRVDAGHSWIDIRLDKITYPAGEPQVAIR